jgi:RecB family exonuclease
VRRRLHADLQRYLQRAAGIDSPLEPSALELGFGFEHDDERGEGSTLPALELGEGVRLRGRIDRIDTSDDGRAVVYDYKGRHVPAGNRWIADGSLQVALYMRAAQDLLGLDVVGGLYQPLAGESLRARGAIDGDADIELDCVRTDVVDHDALQALVADAVAAARQVAREAGRGELQPRPPTCAFGGGCKYPTICRCER